MATSKINSNLILRKSFTSQQFTINPSAIGNVPFDVNSFNIPGYKIVTWRYSNASTVGLRNNVNYFTLKGNAVGAYNFGTTTETGTASIYVIYVREDYLIDV